MADASPEGAGSAAWGRTQQGGEGEAEELSEVRSVLWHPWGCCDQGLTQRGTVKMPSNVRALHYVLKITDRGATVDFMRDILGMHALR